MLIYTYQKSKKKKLTKKQLQEQEDFMKSINNIPSPSGRKGSIVFKKTKPKTLVFNPVPPRPVSEAPSLPDTVLGALSPKGMMKNLHKLSQSDREIVKDVAECTAPLHKSNYVYVTPGLNPAGLGRKNETL